MTLASRLIYSFELILAPGLDLGETPVGSRRVFDFVGGTIQGLVNGKIRSGSDWILVDRNGSSRLDIRQVIELDDGHLVTAQFGGRIVLPQDVRRMTRPERVALDPSRYYFRSAPVYDTASERYGWLNNILAVGLCRFIDSGIGGEVYEVL